MARCICSIGTSTYDVNTGGRDLTWRRWFCRLVQITVIKHPDWVRHLRLLAWLNFIAAVRGTFITALAQNRRSRVANSLQVAMSSAKWRGVRMKCRRCRGNVSHTHTHTHTRIQPGEICYAVFRAPARPSSSCIRSISSRQVADESFFNDLASILSDVFRQESLRHTLIDVCLSLYVQSAI